LLASAQRSAASISEINNKGPTVVIPPAVNEFGEPIEVAEGNCFIVFQFTARHNVNVIGVQFIVH
jgi:hypothetical protein